MNQSITKRGKFIVFEGIDGSGKTTQIEMLAERLSADGRSVYRTAEPTSTVTGGLLRDALCGISRRTECEMAALFVIDRISHNVNPVNGIQKMLADGFDVICDRYYYSSLAYQGSDTDFDWVKDMNINCPEILTPDVCIFIDLEPSEAIKRIGKGRAVTEIYEKEESLRKFRNRYFNVFQTLESSDKVVVVDGSMGINDISDEIYRIVTKID